MSDSNIRLRTSDDPDVAYVELPEHPGSGKASVAKTVRLHDLVGVYTGPDLNFDFDAAGRLIGIEILG